MLGATSKNLRSRWGLPAAALLAVLACCSVLALRGGDGDVALPGASAAGDGFATPSWSAPATAGPLPQDRAGHAITLATPLQMAGALEGDGNLFEYARQLRLAADNGDAQAAWTISRVYDYCSLYALDPAAYALDDSLLGGFALDATPALVAARQRLGQRCQGFTRADQLGRVVLLQRRQQAAEAGNLAAEAALLAMGAPLSDDADYRRQLVERVLQSQDAQAFSALSPAMGATAAGDPAMHGLVAGSQFTQLAWQIAACRLGQDCGPDSLLMNGYCANGGICSRRPDQDFEAFVFDAAVPRQGAETMHGLVSQLRRGREEKQ